VSIDSLQRFIFDNADVRGALVSLNQSFFEMVDNQHYGQGKMALLAEFAAATVLLTGHLKIEGAFSLQARGSANVDLVMAECNDVLEYRGIVRGENSLDNMAFAQIFAGGTLAITMMPKKGNTYQGIVPLQGNDLATCLVEYFNQSEQLPTWFRFSVSAKGVTGMMLQAMPAQICRDAEQSAENWNRFVHLASTLSSQEMDNLDHEEILYRLFHEESVRVFPAEPVHYQCTCSAVRMERGLLTLGEMELRQLIEEQQEIKTQCHFCLKEYAFSKSDILGLIQGAGSQNSH
jgi:molecular chaperone Hsp33